MLGNDTLAVRWAPAESTVVEAQLRSKTFDIRIMRTHWLFSGERIFNPRWPFVMMFYGENELVQAAYCDDCGHSKYVRQGRLFFVPAGENLVCQWKPGVQRGLHCMFDIDRIARCYGVKVSDSQLDKTGALRIHNEYIAAIMRRISEEVSSPGEGSESLIELSLLLLTMELVRSQASLTTENGLKQLSKNDIAFVRNMCMDTNLEFPTIDSIAGALGISVRHLAVAFRQSTGLTLRNFMAQARMERAKKLLADRGLLVKQVAFQSGFVSFASFCGAFRRETGFSPARYRAQFLSSH